VLICHEAEHRRELLRKASKPSMRYEGVAEKSKQTVDEILEFFSKDFELHDSYSYHRC